MTNDNQVSFQGEKDDKNTAANKVNTGGGAYIGGNVCAQEFVGRDKYELYQDSTYQRLDYQGQIADILNFYTKVFVGRRNDWEYIADFARQPTPGYLLIEAGAGFGKSAFIAHLVQRRETGRWDRPPAPTLLYFFIRQEGGRNTPKYFLQALNSQLLDVLKLKGGVPQSEDALGAQFSELWGRAIKTASAEHPLLLLVDGLDEMTVVERTIAHELPPNLASFVHIVVTSRPNPKALEQVDVTHPFKQAGVRRLQTFNQVEIQALLQESGVGADQAAALAPRVLKMTRGEPLFARFVAKETAEHGESVLDRLEQDPPDDVEEYFRQQFKNLDNLVQGKLAWDILGLLTAALGGITQEEIAAALGASKRDVRLAIAPIRRFLLGEDKLELMHLQLRKVVNEEFSGQEKEEYRGRILDWCRRYQISGWPAATPDYVLEHYAQHLAQSGPPQDLYSLIDRRWKDLKFERTGSHRTFANDINLIVETTAADRSQVGLLQGIRGCIVYATLAELATDIPVELFALLVHLDKVERARDTASLVQDPMRLCQAFRAIGDALTKRENAAERIKDYRLAAQAALKIQDQRTKGNMLVELAEAILDVGARDEAGEIARHALACGVAIDSTCAFARLAIVSLKAGVHDTAIEAAAYALNSQSYVDPSTSVDLLDTLIAQLRAENLLSETVIRVTSTVDDIDNLRRIDVVLVYLRLARLLLKAQALEDAWRVVRQARKFVEAADVTHSTIGLLVQLAELTVQLGDQAEADAVGVVALSAVQAINDRWDQALELASLATSLLHSVPHTAIDAAVNALAIVKPIGRKHDVANMGAEYISSSSPFGTELDHMGFPERSQRYSAEILAELAEALLELRLSDKAAEAVDAGLAVLDLVGDPDEIVKIFRRLANISFSLGKQNEVTEVATRVVQLVEERGASIGVASRWGLSLQDQAGIKIAMLVNLAEILTVLGMQDEAARVASEALDNANINSFRLYGWSISRQSFVRLLVDLMAIFLKINIHAEAMRVGGYALVAAAVSAVDGRNGLGLTKNDVETLSDQLRANDCVAGAIEQALIAITSTMEQGKQVQVLIRLGQLLKDIGLMNESDYVAAQARNIVKSIDGHWKNAKTRVLLALEFPEIDSQKEVRQTIDAALKAAASFQSRSEWVEELAGLSSTLYDASLRSEALYVAQNALAVVETDTEHTTDPVSILKLATLFTQMAAETEACKAGREAFTAAVNSTVGRVEVLASIAEELLQPITLAIAAEAATQAMSEALSIANLQQKLSMTVRLARVLIELSMPSQALDALEQALFESQSSGNEPAKIRLLGRMAEALFKAGQDGRAAKILQSLSVMLGRSEPIPFYQGCEIARILAVCTDSHQISDVIGKISGGIGAQMLAWRDVIEFLASEGWTEKLNIALAAAKTSNNPLVHSRLKDWHKLAKSVGQARKASTIVRKWESMQNGFVKHLDLARFVGRTAVFCVLEDAVELIATINSCEALWEIYVGIEEIDSWWDDS